MNGFQSKTAGIIHTIQLLLLYYLLLHPIEYGEHYAYTIYELRETFCSEFFKKVSQSFFEQKWKKHFLKVFLRQNAPISTL